AIPFDTYAYVKKLKAAGFTEEQAGAQAEALASVVDANLATKHDIAMLSGDMEALRVEVMRCIAEAKSSTVKWVTGLLLAQAAVITTLEKLIN
ncbi:MAG: DUF1640 domain-containing protein, partial [Gammaproteobacteria bacterium]